MGKSGLVRIAYEERLDHEMDSTVQDLSWPKTSLPSVRRCIIPMVVTAAPSHYFDPGIFAQSVSESYWILSSLPERWLEIDIARIEPKKPTSWHIPP
jgi:hypothetical protein